MAFPAVSPEPPNLTEFDGKLTDFDGGPPPASEFDVLSPPAHTRTFSPGAAECPDRADAGSVAKEIKSLAVAGPAIGGSNRLGGVRGASLELGCCAASPVLAGEGDFEDQPAPRVPMPKPLRAAISASSSWEAFPRL